MPLQAALGVLDDVTPPLPDAGPFSLHDADAIAALLVGAGWAAPTTVTHDLELVVEGGSTVEEAAAEFLDIGPTRIVSEGRDDATRAAVVAAIADALRAHVDDNGRVVLGGRVLVTTARR